MRNIILIGLPGSGKTSAGRYVARHFSLSFIDSDEVLVNALGMSIKAYFAVHGEAAFRDQETRVLRELLSQPAPFVLSTGGGAVLRAESREMLKRSGTVLYLHATLEAIYQRLRHDQQRPLLQVPDPLAKIRSLLEEREVFYRETATHVIHSGNGPVSDVAQKIIKQLQADSRPNQ